MIVDERLEKIIRDLHKELPILSFDELCDVWDMVASEDKEVSSTGQSLLYFSNFFEMPVTCAAIISSIPVEQNEDFKSISKMFYKYLHPDKFSLQTTSKDLELAKKLLITKSPDSWYLQQINAYD